MPFKLKHIFRGPAKVLNEVGKSGIFGQRGDHFRVLGVKIGKDLVPGVKIAAVVLTTAFIDPTSTLSTVLTAAASNATVTGLSGGNESQMIKSGASGAASAIIGNMVQDLSIVEKTATYIVASTTVSTVITHDIKESFIHAILTAPRVVLPSNFTLKIISEAALNDNPLRGAFQSLILEEIQEDTISYKGNSKASINLNGPTVTLNNLVVSPNSAGINIRHSNTTASRLLLGISDIYENGLMIDRRVLIQNNKDSNDLSINSSLDNVVQSNIGQCFSTRRVILASMANNLTEPNVTTTASDQAHINIDCIKNAAAGAVMSAAIIMAPEIMGPVFLIQKVAY